MPSTREKHNKQVGEEILELLSKPTAKERSLAEKFKSQGGAQVNQKQKNLFAETFLLIQMLR